MKKYITVLLLALALGCTFTVTGCGKDTSAPAASTQINFTERTFSCIDLLVKLDYSGFYNCFDDVLKKEKADIAT